MTRKALAFAAAAVLVRWLFCFAIFPGVLAAHTTVGAQFFFDSYREIAASLVDHCGYRLACGGTPVLHRPPGYAVLMLATDPTDPRHCRVLLQVFNGLLGGAAVLLTFLAARAWGIGTRAAHFAAAVIAFWPFLVWESKVTVPENLLVALIPLAALLLARAGDSHVAAAALGTTAGAIALTHGSYQVLAPALALILVTQAVWNRKNLVRGAAAAMLIIATFAAVVLPWVERNRRRGYAGVATGFGFHYWKGVYDFDLLRNGGPYFRDNDVPATQFVDPMLKKRGFSGIDTNAERSDPAINRELDRTALLHLRTHPAGAAVKTIVMMSLAWIQQQSPLRAAATALLLLPLAILAVRGVRREPHVVPIAVLLVLLNAAFAAVFVEAMPMRYVLPLMPLAAILAAAGMEAKTRNS